VLLPFVTLALETGARYGTLRRLQWSNVDFANRCLTFGRDKTKSGSKRTIPLLAKAIATLEFWTQAFPDRQPVHYVFPHEKYGAAGADEVFGFTQTTVYDADPKRPTASIKVAWINARERAGLPTFRFHDCRHTAASRLIASGVPLPIVGKILGWSSSQLVKMSARYGHWSVEEMRSAMESALAPKVESGSPKFPPKSYDAETGIVQ